MRDTESSISPSHETLDTEPEPRPVTTDDDLLKSVERAQTLWTMFADAQMRRSEDEMTKAIEDLTREYDALDKLLGRIPDGIRPDVLEVAKDEASYRDVLDKMRHRSSTSARTYKAAALGIGHDFML